MDRPPVAVCRDVGRIYRRPSGDTRALAEVDVAISSGALTVLMGPSGSGKSTLLRILAGLDRPTSGRVVVGGVSLSDAGSRKRRRMRRRAVGYVFQNPSENLISYLTVRQHMHLAAGIKGADEREAEGTLAALGIEHRADNRPHQLSGGEQQRLAFAQAALGAPEMIVADEPTAELDTESAQALVGSLKRLASRGSGIVIATHDPQIASAADAVVQLDDGRVVP